MKSGKQILVITPGFPSDENDSTCIPALQDYVKALQSNCPDYIISVISLQYPFFKKSYHWNGIQVYPCGGKNGKGLRRLKTWWAAFRYFKKISKANKLDIIHSFWLTEAALLGNLFSSFEQAVHICTLLGQDAKKENKYHRFINKSKVKLVFPSRFCAETYLKHTSYPETKIIPMGVDLKEYSTNQNIEKSIDILGVGALIPLKRFDEFVKTIATLKMDFPSIKTVIIGDGPEKEKLHQEIQKHELQDNIELRGSIPRNEVLQYMAKSKILLHPSEFEIFGAVFAEALNSRMYIVSRKVGIAEESNVWLLANNNEEFVKQIAHILNQAPKADFVNFFDIQDTVKAYIALYQ